MIKYSYNDLILLEIPPKEYFLTGTKIDEIANGIAKGEIHCVAGPSNSGKSLTLLHLAINAAIEGNKICYISLENDVADDVERIIDISNIYSLYINENIIENFEYCNLSTEENRKEKLEIIIKQLDDFDIVFVDGTEFLIIGSTPVEVSAYGKSLMNSLRIACREKNSSMILSWQTGRQAGGKKLEDLGLEDLSGSMSVPQQCYTVWMIKQWHEKKFNWKLKLIKCRSKYDFDKTSINVYDDENKIFKLR